MSDEAARILDQITQDCKWLWSQVDPLAVAQQTLIGCIQPKGLKLLHFDWTSGEKPALVL
jgi:hypothetical protein